jgi:hypothetical protein
VAKKKRSQIFIVEKKIDACKLVEEVVMSLKSTRKNDKEQINQICSCRVERRNERRKIKPIKKRKTRLRERRRQELEKI